MAKVPKDYRTYIVAKVKPNETLDALSRLAGQIYSKTVSLVRKVKKKKGFWMSKDDVRRYLKLRYPCTSKSMEAVIGDYFGALKSFFTNAKSNANAKPPYKTRKFHAFYWRCNISCKGKNIVLSMGRGREPIKIEIHKKFRGKEPNFVSMVYNRDTHHYEFHAAYEVKAFKGSPVPNTAVAVDLGEIHPIVAYDGETSEIYNGRAMRSIVQYREKFKAHINQLLSRCKRGSRRYKKLKSVKNRTLYKLNNQLRDVRHKITSRFVSACREKRVETIVIGDLKHIRQSIKYGKKVNQKLHQWTFSKITELITYKAKAVGIRVVKESERYTSQTCPSCGHRKKPSGRVYKCGECGWQGHRDVVGASNLFTKYQGLLFNPVVGAVVSPTGIRYNPNLSRLDAWSPFRGLISKKSAKSR